MLLWNSVVHVGGGGEAEDWKVSEKAWLVFSAQINIPTSNSPSIINMACCHDVCMFLFIYSHSCLGSLICWGSSPGWKLRENRNSIWLGHCFLLGARTVTGTLIVSICGLNKWMNVLGGISGEIRSSSMSHHRENWMPPCRYSWDTKKWMNEIKFGIQWKTEPVPKNYPSVAKWISANSTNHTEKYLQVFYSAPGRANYGMREPSALPSVFVELWSKNSCYIFKLFLKNKIK